MNKWYLEAGLEFEAVIQLIEAQEYHRAMEALFEVPLPANKSIWYRFFRELRPHTLPHVIAFLIGRGLREESHKRRSGKLTHYFTLLNLMLYKKHSTALYFKKDDFKIIADFMADKITGLRLLKFEEAYALAWVMKAGGLVGARSPFKSPTQNARLIFMNLERVGLLDE